MFILDNTIGQNLRAIGAAKTQGADALKKKGIEDKKSAPTGNTPSDTTQAKSQETKATPPQPQLPEIAKLLAAVIKTGQVGLVKIIADTYLPLLYEQGKEAAKQANLEGPQQQKLNLASTASTPGVRQGMASIAGVVAATEYILNDPQLKKLFPEPVIRTAAKAAEAIAKGLNNRYV